MYGIELETRSETSHTGWLTDLFYPGGSLSGWRMRNIERLWIRHFLAKGYTIVSKVTEPDGAHSLILEPAPTSPYYADVRITTWKLAA